MLNKKEIEYIINNAAKNTAELLFASKKSNGSIDIKLCVSCIEARKKIKTKVPEWYDNTRLVYPLSVSVEQCSSQATGRYKQELIKRIFSEYRNKKEYADSNKSNIIADITGGMGIDSYYLAKEAEKLYYFERNEQLYNAALYNFQCLNQYNIIVTNTDIEKNIEILKNKGIALVYADPARRDKYGSKMVSISDCEPDFLKIKERLLEISPYILLKLSPMSDIKQNIEMLPETKEIHIVSVDNECKELLFLLTQCKWQRKEKIENEPEIIIVDIESKEATQSGKSFIKAIKHLDHHTIQDEEKAIPQYASEEDMNRCEYLYDPNKSILKAGAFKSTAVKYNLLKIAQSTHLYLSSTLQIDFPGKIFKISKISDYNKNTIEYIRKFVKQANIRAMNFPETTEQVKRNIGIKDGGELFVFIFTSAERKKKVIIGNLYK